MNTNCTDSKNVCISKPLLAVCDSDTMGNVTGNVRTVTPEVQSTFIFIRIAINFSISANRDIHRSLLLRSNVAKCNDGFRER